MSYVEVSYKFGAVLNKKIPAGILMNALGHMTAGLAANYPELKEMRFDNYMDADGNSHPYISDNPFIILEATNSNQIRKLRIALSADNIRYVDFTSTMTQGTYQEQQERTHQTSETDLEYYGVVIFGKIEKLNHHTRKFSLWKG